RELFGLDGTARLHVIADVHARWSHALELLLRSFSCHGELQDAGICAAKAPRRKSWWKGPGPSSESLRFVRRFFLWLVARRARQWIILQLDERHVRELPNQLRKIVIRRRRRHDPLGAQMRQVLAGGRDAVAADKETGKPMRTRRFDREGRRSADA